MKKQKKNESVRTQRRREQRRQRKDQQRQQRSHRFISATTSSEKLHNGQHGIGCKECEKHMMKQISVDKTISKFNDIHVKNPYAPIKQIRDYLGLKVNYIGKERGQRISQEKIEQLVDEYSEYLIAS